MRRAPGDRLSLRIDDHPEELRATLDAEDYIVAGRDTIDGHGHLGRRTVG